ncbi:ribosomal protein S18-alanine N-acetyltransferase [Terrarubrum flagellatum]|uniref:ribosomal protein S18-alanine N-acetyltransferase n=1 Tax=Terrirubrum flagellatum TaxID=2895980 RepID=UPI00314542AA
MLAFFAARPILFRPLSSADARAVAHIHAEGFARGWPADEIEAMILDPAVVGDGAATAGWPGALAGFVLSRIAADEAEILSICVRRKNQGKGVAGRLLNHHLSRLGQRGARAVFLEVEEGNTPAIALYRRYGFAEVGRRKSYYPKADGRTADALTMRRDMV